MADDIQLLVNYYVRMGYAQHVRSLCSQHVQKGHKDPVLLFWHAFGLLLEGSNFEALEELRALADHREVEVATVAAMLHAQESCTMVEKEEDLELRLEAALKCASERALFLAATLFSHLGSEIDVKKSKELIAKILQVQTHYAPAQCLNGWLHLLFDKHGSKIGQNASLDIESMENALSIFDEVLAQGNCLEALLGRAYYYELQGEIAQAIDELNQVIVSYGWYIPALCEKGRLGLLLQDWPLVQETAQLILQKDPNNIDGMRMTIHIMLCTEHNVPSTAHLLKDLLKCISQKESRNANLCFRVACSMARIAGRGRAVILHQTVALVEKARGIFPEQAAYAMEMAYEQFLLADYKAALLSYRLASELDKQDMEARYGAVQCLLVLGQLMEVEQQLEHLEEIDFSSEESPSFCYLWAQLAWEKSKDYGQCRELLLKTVEYHTKALKNTYDYDFYTQLSPDRLLGAAHLFSVLSKYECKGLHVNKSFCLRRVVEILELVLSSIPGLLIGHLMLAEALIQLEELDSALSTLHTAHSLDATCATSQILLTQVYIQLGKYELAKQSLEQALSEDFVVRDTVKYHVFHGKILLQADENEEALKVLESAMYLPEMKNSSADSYKAYYSTLAYEKIGGTTDSDRVLVYLLQAKVHMRFGHVPEATKIVQDANHQFTGTPEEVQVVLANCDLALGRGDVSAAIALLQQVPCESNYYVQAKVAIADIYIRHWHDKASYLNCYLELVKMFPNAKTHMMLGDAFMKVDELERAGKAYEAAIKEVPKDALVASHVGKALVATHNYAKAVEHYKTSIQNTEECPMKLSLRYDLADLYFKLKKYEKVEVVLNDMLAKAAYFGHEDKELKNKTTLLLCLKGSLLLSKVQHLRGKCGTLSEECSPLSTDSKYLQHYKVMFSAKNVQNRMLQNTHGLHEDTIREQKNVAADIYFQFAQECEAQKDLEKTVTLLNEALNCNPAHISATLALAKISLSRGEVIECEQMCAEILRSDPFNSDAGDILVHLMLFREMYESTIIHFKENLERDPTHYASLAQLIRLLQNAGQLDEAHQIVLKTEKALSKAHTHAGLYFCKGLIARYSNNRVEALQLLNHARADAEWGQPAIYLLIEVYLNIETELVWEEVNWDGSASGSEEGITAAWKLLGESRLLDCKSVKQLVLECYATMATRQKADIEFALGRLSEILAKEENKQNVPILLAAATALTLLKQTAKAKNQLRIIDRSVYKWDNGEDFERAWLMLAGIFMQSGKYDAAEELCRKCLKYNKNCGRAWEYLGLIMETSHSCADAVGYLENAWKCQREASPSVGYRLAFTYLKEKRYIEAISVCHKVLKKCKGYPRIKKDILDKARLCIRV